jgi:hypothetical protein
MDTDWIAILTAWGPFLLLILVWLVMARRNGMRAKAPSGQTMLELYEQQVEQMKRQAVLLERIAVALEARGET